MEAAPSLVARLSEAYPLLVGVAATLLAAFAVGSWIAIGSVFLPTSALRHEEVATPASILIGSAATAFVYALMTRRGIVDGAMLIVGAASLLAIVGMRREVRRIAFSTIDVYRETFASNRLVRFAAFPVGVLLWIYAIAPPRDGDVMRYHLAHIRQIISDGGWLPIADYHYAFPFGWTLNYLPFERLHLPEAASLVNVCLWLVIVAGLLRLARVSRAPLVASMIAVAFFVHPFVMRTFASAMADGYALLVVFTISLLLIRLHDTRGVAMLLGFVCWIGAQSRYQLIAWGIAGSCVFVVDSVRRGSTRRLKRFAIGAILALVLSAPFYLANFQTFGNPVWPLLVSSANEIGYADRVAAAYTANMTGARNPAYILRHLWELVSTPELVPLAILVLLVVPTAIRTKTSGLRRVAVAGTIFIALWIVAEPKLFPRHVLLLLPLGALLFVPALEGIWERGRAVRLIERAAGTAVVLLIAMSAFFSWDYARYAVTGNRDVFHRFTWYYPLYMWVNHNTPPAARVLVITYSGHSYYLDRRYRRADPWLSGVVDWSSITSADDLQRVMQSGKYEYMVYDDRNWRMFPDGAEMEFAVKSAIARGLLVPVHRERDRLYTSRVRRTFEDTDVYVLRLATGAVAAATDVPSFGKNASLNR